jgi:hypothetical protein
MRHCCLLRLLECFFLSLSSNCFASSLFFNVLSWHSSRQPRKPTLSSAVQAYHWLVFPYGIRQSGRKATGTRNFARSLLTFHAQLSHVARAFLLFPEYSITELVPEFHFDVFFSVFGLVIVENSESDFLELVLCWWRLPLGCCFVIKWRINAAA